MFKLLKYLPLVGLFRDAVTAWTETEGGPIPVILHRRVFGAVIMLIGTGVGIYFGLATDVLNGDLNLIIDNLDKMISAGLVVYGAIMAIVGAVGAKRNAK